MANITDAGIRGAINKAVKKAGDDKIKSQDVWVTDSQKSRGTGRLRVRATPSGAAFYFRYFNADGKEEQIRIGTYDEKGRDGLTLKEAIAKFGEYSLLYQDGTRDLRQYLEHAEAAARDDREAAIKAREELERQTKSGSLQRLLDGYVAHLTRQKKQSAQDVRNIYRRNITDEFPRLAATRAADITHRDISTILAKLIDRGAGRTAAKLRSYLRAAYGEALVADGEPTAHPDLHGFNLTVNPAALVPAKKLSAFNRARERTLNETELRAFLVAMDKQSGVVRDAILLALYLGGQRSAQLVRLKPGDVDLAARELTLYDPKGARQKPRVHGLPLTDQAAEIVQRLIATNGEKGFLITLKSKAHVRTETLSAMVTDISTTLVEEKISREPFELRDLRRTCETMMARMKIPKEVRAHILSHGLGGVQARHYDKHDYADEKRSALEQWAAELERIKSGKARARARKAKGSAV